MNDDIVTTLRALNGAFLDLIGETLLSDALRVLAVKVVQLLDADHATVTLLEESGQFFRIEAEHPPSAPSLLGERITIAGRPTQLELLHSKKPVVVDCLRNHPMFEESSSFQMIAERLDIRSMLIVPIIFGESMIGTISLDSLGRAHSFSDQDIELCRTIANQASVAIANARLLDQQAKYRRQAELLTYPPIRRGSLAIAERISQEVLESLSNLISFKKASVQLIVEGKRTLLAASGFKKEVSAPWLLRPVDTDPIIKAIVDTKEILVVPNTDRAAGWEKQPATADVNSWIGIPLVFQGNTIGLITLDHPQPGFYENISQSLLSQLDDRAALAAARINDAYELEVAQRHIQALEAISYVAERTATTLHINELLPVITTAISGCLGSTLCSLFLLVGRNHNPRLVCNAACPQSAMSLSPIQVPSTPPPQELLSPLQGAYYTRTAILIDDLSKTRSFDTSHELFKNARSVIVVPLKIADEPVGVVSAIHEEPGWFSKSDQLLLETLTRHAGIAIERDTGLELVHSIGNNILGANVDEVLREIVSGAMQLTHMDSGVIYLLNETTTKVTHRYQTVGSIHPTPRLTDPRGITRRVISQKRLQQIPDIMLDKDVNPELLSQYRSMVAVPLMLDRAVVGVLYVNGKSVRKLTETEQSLLLTLADQAAFAIQRTRLYQQLREFHSLLDNIPQCVLRKDAHSRFVSANASFCQSLNRTLEDISGKTDRDFYEPEKAAKYVYDDEEVMLTRRNLEVVEEHQLLGSDRTTWVRVIKTPVLDDDKVVGVQAIFWDVTEQRQIEERWRSLVEQSPDSIVIHEKGRITLANPAAVRLFGADNEAGLRGRSILEFIDERSRGLAADRLEKLVRKEAVEPMVEMKVRRLSGEVVDVEVYGRPGPGRDEVQVVFHELTRTKTLLREMHHRVRRSLNQVESLLTLQERHRKDARTRSVFAAIRERIAAMALVHTILQATEQESRVEMGMYLRALVDAVFDAYGTADNRIDRTVDVVDIVLDEKHATACGLIVTELVANSLLHAFGKGQGQVYVALTTRGERLALVVADNGSGIDPNSERSMGLSLVELLVQDALKGTVMQDLTRGTRFMIEFARKTNHGR